MTTVHRFQKSLGVFCLVACLGGASTPLFAQKKTAKSAPVSAFANAPYKDAKLPIEQRVADLLPKMTLDEKLGQMTQLCASSITLDGSKKLDLNMDKIRAFILKQHVGSFLSGTGTAERWVDFIAQMQAVAMTESRLGIPVIFAMDNVHGSDYTDEATMLPHNINLGCTFNRQLAKEAALITAFESADLGHHWNFAPVLDVGKNPYWPRFYETFGEDPLVCGVMGTEFIKATQAGMTKPYKQAACAKHFIGYSDPKSGWDRTPSEIPAQSIYEVFVPPFRMAIDEGKVMTLMVNSGELNGEAVHGSKKLLDGLLRKRLGFDGVIVTDIKDIVKMVEMHAAAANEREATKMSIDAGIDMSMACSGVEFIGIMKDLLAKGELTESRIDESVRRILKLKFELGLFEYPYPTKSNLKRIASPEHLRMAKESAKESMVLMKNEGILPIQSGKKVLVAGFAANSKRNLNGAWTLEWLGASEARQPKHTVTLYQALTNALPAGTVTLADSAAEVPNSQAQFVFARQCAEADVVVLTIGETPYSEFKGNTNELTLNDNHRVLAETAIKAGKPVVLVLIEGRPRVLGSLAQGAQAIIFAGHPGTSGGLALAELLTGKDNFSGKLAFTYPASGGHNVPYYHKKSEKYTGLYPFGYGLSYTNYAYSNLRLSDTVINAQKAIAAIVKITNTGAVDGKEAVLWFLQDEVGAITRPVKQLKQFEKLSLKVGESKEVSFAIEPKHLQYPDEDGTMVLEPGYFTLLVGTEKARFRLTK